MFDQLLAEILASLIKGFPRTTTTTTTTKQNVDPAVHFVYSRVKIGLEHMNYAQYSYLFLMVLSKWKLNSGLNSVTEK
jgi:hypothetical protein